MSIEVSTNLRISPSKLSELSSCSYRVFLDQTHPVERRSGPHQIVGSVTHEAQRFALQNKARGLEIGPDDLEAVVRRDFDRQWERVRLTTSDRFEGEELVRERSLERAIRFADRLLLTVVPQIEAAPDDLERKIELQIEGAALDIVGRSDVFERERRRVRDLKTAKRKPTVLSASIQSQFYAWALQQSGAEVESILIDTLVQKGDGPEKVDHFQHSVPLPPSWEPLMARIALGAAVLASGAFFPADPSGPSGWVCSEEFCHQWEACRFGGGTK